MRIRNAHIAPLALAALAVAATAACATSPSTARVREEKEPLVAREVVVQTKVDARGGIVVTPDPAILRPGQKLVIAACCEELKVTWKKPVPGIPDPRCEGGECTLVAPPVKETTEVFYTVSGKCGDKPFELDPRLIFIK